MKASQTYTVGSDVSAQQNGVVYANPNTIISISLSGVLNVFDSRESSSSKWRTLHGPTKAITACALSGSTFYAGSFDGTMKTFMVGSEAGEEEGACHEVVGAGHTARIAGLHSDGTGKIWSAGWDDKVACIERQSFEYASASSPLALRLSSDTQIDLVAGQSATSGTRRDA